MTASTDATMSVLSVENVQLRAAVSDLRAKLGEREQAYSDLSQLCNIKLGELKACETKLVSLEAELLRATGRLEESTKLLDRENKKIIALEDRIAFYEKALEDIIRDGSDTYGILSLAAQQADSALNAVLDNAALAANPIMVVERRVNLGEAMDTLNGLRKPSE